MSEIILFKDDWKNYPTASLQLSTKNHSFLRQAEAYQRMGVKNCDFCLALLNPDLAYVDPFHRDLPLDIQEAIAAEAFYNPWYYYRELAKIEPKGGGGKVIHLQANRGIMYFLWCTMNDLNVYLIQHRQSGKSVASDFETNYMTHIKGYKSSVSILTKDDALRAEQIERIKGLRDNLPVYLNPYRKSFDGDPRDTLECTRLKNTIITAVPRSSEKQARNVGRGMTSPIALIDEGPFIPFISIIVRAMLGSTSTARRIAREEKQTNYAAFVTTAGDRMDRDGAYMYRIYRGGLQFDERLFFDCPSREKLKEMVKNARKGPMEIVCATFSHRQLGVSDEDFQQLLVDNAAEGEEADRDYFNIWTNGGLTCPIPEAIKLSMQKHVIEPVWCELDPDHGYVVRWYITEAEVKAGCINRRLVVGMDTSDGIGNDSLTMYIMDADTGETVGCSDINEANLFHYGRFLARFIARFKLMVLIPERKSSGMALIDALIAELPKYGLDPFRVIYNTVVEDFWYESKEYFAPMKRDPLTRSEGFYDSIKKYFGFVTSANGRHARSTLFNRVLLMAAKASHAKTRDRLLVDQLTGLVVKNGRLDHAEGKHDDLVIGYLLAFWWLTSTPNLEYYGLGGALSRCKMFDEVTNPEEKKTFDVFIDAQQQFYRSQCSVLLEQLEKTTDNLIAMRIEAKLDAMSQRLRSDVESGSTLDAMISTAKQKRQELLTAKMKEARKGNRGGSNPYSQRW